MTTLVTPLSRIHRAAICSLILLGYIFAGCGSAPTLATPTSGASYRLMVINGSGGGEYPMGSTIHVWANPYEQGWTFDRWTGETQSIPDLRSMHATLIMPSEDIRIEATYKEIPVWTASFASLLGRDVYYYLPPEGYNRILLFFHGSGGDAREWSGLGAERRHFFDEAVAAGHAFLAIDSADRVNKQWDLTAPPAANPDLEAVEAILKTFRADKQIPDNASLYAVGLSQGGRFATLAAYALDMQAAAIWVGAGHEEIMPITTVPAMWCLADYDPIIDSQEVSVQYRQLRDRGVDAIFYVNPPTPLSPLYFASIEGIDKSASAQLFADLISQDYLDENYFLIDNPRLSKWENHIGLEYSETIRQDIRERLMVAYAEHTFYSDCDHRVLDFFDSHP